MNGIEVVNFIKKLGICVGIGILSLAVLLALSSAIALSTGDPDPLLLPLSLTSLSISCIVTGVASAKLCSEYIGTLLSSLSASAFFILLHFLTSLFVSEDNSDFSTGIKLLLYCGLLLLGLLGGVIGRPKARKRPVHHRRNRR